MGGEHVAAGEKDLPFSGYLVGHRRGEGFPGFGLCLGGAHVPPLGFAVGWIYAQKEGLAALLAPVVDGLIALEHREIESSLKK